VIYKARPRLDRWIASPLIPPLFFPWSSLSSPRTVFSTPFPFFSTVFLLCKGPFFPSSFELDFDANHHCVLFLPTFLIFFCRSFFFPLHPLLFFYAFLLPFSFGVFFGTVSNSFSPSSVLNRWKTFRGFFPPFRFNLSPSPLSFFFFLFRLFHAHLGISPINFEPSFFLSFYIPAPPACPLWVFLSRRPPCL